MLTRPRVYVGISCCPFIRRLPDYQRISTFKFAVRHEITCREFVLPTVEVDTLSPVIALVILDVRINVLIYLYHSLIKLGSSPPGMVVVSNLVHPLYTTVVPLWLRVSHE